MLVCQWKNKYDWHKRDVQNGGRTMTFGDKLSTLRKENNFTQEQLADVLGVSRQAISKWESDTTYPETDKLIRICKLFHCSTDYLLLEDENSVEKQSQNISVCKCLPDNQLLMNEVIKFIDMLFSHQRKNIKTDASKEKLLNQMTGNINDLLLQGKDEVEALKIAKKNVADVEWLNADNQLTDMQEYLAQCSYSTLLNCTLFWIFSLPLLFVKYAPICFVGLVLTLIFGIFYILKSKKNKTTNILALVSISKSRQRKKTVWILWGISFSILIITKVAALFGSNLWFGRPIEITGPYSVINIALQIYVPMLTVFIPITVGGFTNILSKYEKRYDDEKEK